jgi:hypothetical protein
MYPPKHITILQLRPLKHNLFLLFQITQRNGPLVSSHNLGSLHDIEALIFHSSCMKL